MGERCHTSLDDLNATTVVLHLLRANYLKQVVTSMRALSDVNVNHLG